MKRFTTFLLTLLLFTLGASAQTDYSSKITDTWAHGGNGYSTGIERYSTDPYGAGRVLYQTISGLPAGTYSVTFYAVANMAWISAAYGNNIAQVFANETAEDVEVYNQTGFDNLNAYSHTLQCTVGVDGILDYGLQNVGTGGNWYVCQGVSLYLTEASDATLKEGATLHGEDEEVDEIGHWSQSFTSTGTYGGLDYNTWSGEAGMTTPYHQVWVWTGESEILSDQTISHAQFTNQPAGIYTVTVDARVLSEADKAINTNSAFFCANDASVDIVAEATTDEEFEYNGAMEHEVNGTYTLTATVTEDGTLDISFTIKDATYNWVSWKNLKVVYEGAAEEEEPEPEDDGAYKFVAEEWVASDDTRASADVITYNADNTITVAATGANNIALGNHPSKYWDNAQFNDITTAEMYVTADQKWFVIIGSDLATGDTDSYWWWMNGNNDWTRNNGQIVPDQVVTLDDGQVLFAWDVSSDLTAWNGVTAEDGKIYLNGGTCFGLTTTGTSSTISDINFYTDEELQAIIASDEEPGTFEPTTVSYTDYLHVVLGSEDEVMEATVDVEYTAANVINFTLYDLAVAGTKVGNVTVTGITLEDDGDGVCTFSYSGNDVTVSGGDFDSLIKLVSITIEISGDITEEKLHANMTVDVTMGSSSLLSITADFGYSEAPEPEEIPSEVIHDETTFDHWSISGNSGGSFQYNTWSTEADPSGMVTPFIEYWVGSGNHLSNATISHQTLTDLAEGFYVVSVDVRAFNENSLNKIEPGIVLSANGTSVDVSLGTHDVFNSVSAEAYGTFEVPCMVGEDGTLDIAITLTDCNCDWLAFKNVKVTYMGTEYELPAAADITPVDGDMSTAKSEAQEAAIAAYAATPETAIDLYQALADAQLCANFYADVAAMLEELDLDEAGQTVWAATENGAAYEEKTLEYCDMTDTYVEAVKAQTTAGSDMTYALLNSGEWAADQGNGPSPYNTFATETYIESGEATEGTVLYKTIEGLTPGTYTVSFYVAANMANGVSGDSGEGITQAFANGEVEAITVGTNSGAQITSLDDMTLVTITCTVDSDGVLEFGLQNVADGGNWFLGAAASLTLVEAAEVEDLSELIAQYEADCTAAEECEANLADMIENGDKTDETKAEMAEALEALEAVMAEYGNIDTTATTAEELTEAIAAIEAALAEAQDVYATGLQSVTVATEDDAIYTLSGVRVSKAVKGVYIVNGKKVLVK